MSLLVLDDLGLAALTDPERRDLLEVIEDRHGSASTIITSQLPVEHWHEVIGDPTIADALLDRLVHNAHRISLKGESMRKTKASVDSDRRKRCNVGNDQRRLTAPTEGWPHSS